MFDAAVTGDVGLLRYHLTAKVDPNYQHAEYMCTPLVACILTDQYDAAVLHRRNPAMIRLIDPAADVLPKTSSSNGAN